MNNNSNNYYYLAPLSLIFLIVKLRYKYPPSLPRMMTLGNLC